MKRTLYAGLWLLALSAAVTAFRVALGQDSENPVWVPFVANQVEDNRGRANGLNSKTQVIFAREKNGSTCTIWLSSDRSASLTAHIYDRPHHVIYDVDFRRKTIAQKDEYLAGKFGFADKPMSRQDFNLRHRQDKFLGKKVLSGIECEGYRLHDPQHEGKFMGEAWYAPSLDFEPIKSEYSYPGGLKTSTVIEDIQVGKEPDPQLCRIPEGFPFLQ